MCEWKPRKGEGGADSLKGFKSDFFFLSKEKRKGFEILLFYLNSI